MSNFPEGRGIFETLKTNQNQPQFLELHLQRAVVSSQKVAIKIPSIGEIANSIMTFLAQNPVPTEAGRLRIEFLESEEIIFSHSPYERWTEPALITTTGSRVNEKLENVGIKSLPYSENMDLINKARLLGFDEVIRFNLSNQVCEGATSNLLFKIDGRWATPDLASGCLPGVTRALCLQWFEIQERAIQRDELADVESAFIISSLRGMQPVSSIGPHELVVDSAMVLEGQARMQADSID